MDVDVRRIPSGRWSWGGAGALRRAEEACCEPPPNVDLHLMVPLQQLQGKPKQPLPLEHIPGHWLPASPPPPVDARI